MVKFDYIFPLLSGGMRYFSMYNPFFMNLSPDEPSPAYIYQQTGSTVRLIKAPYRQNGSEVTIL